MQLTVKTLKGGKFTVDAAPSSTVADVKGLIVSGISFFLYSRFHEGLARRNVGGRIALFYSREAAKSELPAATMKLIHSGKVLKDADSIESCNIKPTDFLVVMITKAKKAAAAPAPAPPAPVASPAPVPTPAVVAAPAPAATEPTVAAPPADDFPAEVINNLTGMGFPEAEARACLRAASGNPDIAVEFLMNGIPPAVQAQQAAATTGSSSSGEPLAALRSHPQFDALRRLVQSNPQTLQAVLTQIGQQQPELLREINANQAQFLEMMNEPIADEPAAAPSVAPTVSSPAAPTGAGGMPAGLMEGMGNPAQMAQMLQSMSPNELNEMASMMNLTPEQLTATAQMISQMPPEQFQEYMMQAMQQGGGMGMPGMMGGGGAGMGGGSQPQMLRLTEEEMAAVDRLTEMGFDRADAAQAFLACDKNEALAANLLMDGGFGFGGDEGGDFGGGGGGNGNDDGDDMYD
eukprot:scaffold78720_cov45-Attheya_sp.AAC.1